jgi:hypothetical protein
MDKNCVFSVNEEQVLECYNSGKRVYLHLCLPVQIHRMAEQDDHYKMSLDTVENINLTIPPFGPINGEYYIYLVRRTS